MLHVVWIAVQQELAEFKSQLEHCMSSGRLPMAMTIFEYDSDDEELLSSNSEEQLMAERVGWPTKKPNAPANPNRQFARKVRRVLQRNGLLRRMLAKTVVNVLSRSPVQLRRLDELLHEEALKQGK
ncbi:GH12641 [Drosophila grimshawi]|uniref:GH12641 n=1 Tax=Drosophila grimshawi TaxID=7222 RepID=B4JKD5_DROGR|nr:GH12641 [Drosophila grimshawi]